ncbi:hypothetical protein ABL78_1634 [Leptomonas seymouri]|uniref:Uncharacterized protein n=1 Tax=Leptomonas seymouri TaxID=5684 RepID=A0A0N1IAE7_LEPSE|nr:hypothetical protein ABL78_1634 [Leptomonas seymouri]|eukprot:KPI89301.1 hypothetical protein ABL78_1634 [Leptomonas seymouri]
MVQYWLVKPSTELQATLRELCSEIAMWERVRLGHAEKKAPCSFACISWARAADSLLPYPSSVGSAHAVHTEVQSLEGCGSLRDSLSYVSRDSTLPMPLLHPKFVERMPPSLLFAAGSAELPPNRDFSTRYLPSSTWVPLYCTQL